MLLILAVLISPAVALPGGPGGRRTIAHNMERCATLDCCFVPQQQQQRPQKHCAVKFGVGNLSHTVHTFPWTLSLFHQYESELVWMNKNWMSRANFPNDTWWEKSRSIATGGQDMMYLYALVRFFKPANVLEVGTYIGTTATIMAQALRKNHEEDPSTPTGQLCHMHHACRRMACNGIRSWQHMRISLSRTQHTSMRISHSLALVPAGHVYTVDMAYEYLAQPRDANLVTFINKRSGQALWDMLRSRGFRKRHANLTGLIDFVFWDANIFPGDLTKLAKLINWARPSPYAACCGPSRPYCVLFP